MDPRDLPRFTLRSEVLDVLRLFHQASDEGTFPPLSPRELLGLLNHIGPALGDECLPLVELLLDGLWEQGLVGRIPAPTPLLPRNYMIREAAEVAIGWGAPVILLPWRDQAQRP